MKLSVIIPAYNEEKTISSVINLANEQEIFGWTKEVIVVDDGSTDRTWQILSEISGLKILRHEKNQGKGSAIRTGLGMATGDYVIIQDADLEYSPADWPLLLREVGEKGQNAVFGSRNLNPERRGYSHYIFGVWLLTKMTNILFGSRLTDVYTCYKVLPLNLMKSLEISSQGFEFEAEVTAKILKKRVEIKEVPVSYSPRKFTEGKKIRALDGLTGAWILFKIWLKMN